MSTMLAAERPSESRNDIPEILQRGFTEVAVGPDILKPVVDAIIAGMTLITDDVARYRHFPWYPIVTDAYGVGYEQEVGLREPEENKRGERKFTFQYRPAMEEDMRLCGVPVAEYDEFLRALSGLDQLVQGHTLMVAEAIDAAYQWRFGSLAERMREGSRTIRVLRYLPRKEDVIRLGVPDAAVHVDRSGFTSHVYASHEGLRVFASDGSHVGIDETGYSSIGIFPGEKLGAMTEGALGFGTPHGVRDTRQADGRRDCDRFAIVAFAHPACRQADADWLLAHKAEIEAYEKGFRL